MSVEFGINYSVAVDKLNLGGNMFNRKDTLKFGKSENVPGTVSLIIEGTMVGGTAILSKSLVEGAISSGSIVRQKK